MRVSDQGGEPEAVPGYESHTTVHFTPNFLPDGRSFLFSMPDADTRSASIIAVQVGDEQK